MYPPLLKLPSEEMYRRHFEQTYCRGPIITFDEIMVRFRKRDFDHCCFESSMRNGVKDQFSDIRAERLDWISEALRDPNSDRFCGWDSQKKHHDRNRRVAVVMGDYIVVIALTGAKKANFITAYVADTPTSLAKIKAGPRWI
ncbi:MAG: hypothetical protein HQL94_00105 [Magnetococcales bacterium]|nr:hypothetical protein [Magnetococcales bacterium]